MATISPSTRTDGRASSPRDTRSDIGTLAAGVAHPAAWITGLALWGTNLDVHASGATIVGAYAPDAGRAATQATLVHGVAGVALAAVAIGIARLARSKGHVRLSRWIALTGVAAAAVSLTQWVLDLLLALAAAPAGRAGSALTLLTAIDRLDGVKMILIAALAVATALLVRSRTIPRWEAALAVVLAATITASGMGYLLLVQPLAALALISGPVLLLWVPVAAFRCWRAAPVRTIRTAPTR